MAKDPALKRIENEQRFSALMLSAQNGSENDYTQLLTELAQFIENYYRGQKVQEKFMEDLVQEFLLAVHKSRHTYSKERPFMSWVLAIANYKKVDLLRIIYKDKKSVEINDELPDENIQTLDALIEKQNLEILQTQLGALDERSKEVLTLLKVSGMKVVEVAEKLNISEANVKVIAHRAILKLKSSSKRFE